MPRVTSESILVWNVSGIGDFADSLPALAELRRRRPRAHIVLAVAEKTVPLAKLFRHVDEVAGFPTRPGRGAPPLNGFLRWVSTIRPWRKRFGIVLELYGVSSGLGLVFTRWLLGWVGAPLTIGRSHGGPRSVFDQELPASETPSDLMASYSKLVSLVPSDRPRFELDEDAPALVIPPEILVEVDHWLDAQTQFEGLSGPLVVVALGGDRPSRREFPERAERWLSLLQREHAIRPVLWGTRQDPGIPSTSSVIYADGRALDGLVYSAALVARADAVITTQTSAQHLVSVWDVPTLVLVGPADPEKHRPHLSKSSARLVRRKVPCAPCSYHDCPWEGDEYKKCLRGIDPDEVARAFRGLGLTQLAHARS